MALLQAEPVSIVSTKVEPSPNRVLEQLGKHCSNCRSHHALMSDLPKKIPVYFYRFEGFVNYH